MTPEITIVDRGRGPQLSNSRITVQDLVPHWRSGASNEEIRVGMPSLSDEQIAVLFDYIRDHQEEVLAAEIRIKAYHDQMRAAQPPWTRQFDYLPAEERRAYLKEKLRQLKERNGAGHSPG